uniref:Uncharacterized protein n=1 Tax=Anguilla anguilla TaxID=7936 RepID=A0A0E9RAY9_ANGAN
MNVFNLGTVYKCILRLFCQTARQIFVNLHT